MLLFKHWLVPLLTVFHWSTVVIGLPNFMVTAVAAGVLERLFVTTVICALHLHL